MASFNFTYKDTNILINISQTDTSFCYDDFDYSGGILKHYDNVSVKNNKKAQQYEVQFHVSKKDSEGKTIQGTLSVDGFNITGEEYTYFYNANPTTDIIERAVINGMISRISELDGDKNENGIKPFDVTNSYEFAAPVDFELDKTNNTQSTSVDGTITVNVLSGFASTSGVGAFEYKLMDTNDNTVVDWQSSNVFTVVNPNTYHVRVRSIYDNGQSVIKSVVVA